MHFPNYLHSSKANQPFSRFFPGTVRPRNNCLGKVGHNLEDTPSFNARFHADVTDTLSGYYLPSSSEKYIPTVAAALLPHFPQELIRNDKELAGGVRDLTN